MEENPNLRISYESLKGAEYFEALRKRMASGKGNDVFMVNHDVLLELEKMGYLTLDYDYPLDRYSYKEYKESELYAYFCRTVAEGTGRAGFLGDRPVLELGSIAPT